MKRKNLTTPNMLSCLTKYMLWLNISSQACWRDLAALLSVSYSQRRLVAVATAGNSRGDVRREEQSLCAADGHKQGCQLRQHRAAEHGQRFAAVEAIRHGGLGPPRGHPQAEQRGQQRQQVEVAQTRVGHQRCKWSTEGDRGQQSHGGFF